MTQTTTANTDEYNRNALYYCEIIAVAITLVVVFFLPLMGEGGQYQWAWAIGGGLILVAGLLVG